MFDNRIALSVREAAEATGYSPRHIRHHIAAGKLKASPPGGDGDMRILREDLMEWLRAEHFRARFAPHLPTTPAPAQRSAMHPKIAQRREQLTGRRGFRVPGEYIRNPEPWETFSLPGQPQRKPEPPKVTRIQPLVRMQRMSLADAEQYMHEQALRNIAAAQRNRTQK